MLSLAPHEGVAFKVKLTNCMGVNGRSWGQKEKMFMASKLEKELKSQLVAQPGRETRASYSLIWMAAWQTVFVTVVLKCPANNSIDKYS